MLDLSHVLTTLNKLDAGARSREKLMLVSRDSQSCLVVEYRDIYKCIESAYKWVVGVTLTAASCATLASLPGGRRTKIVKTVKTYEKLHLAMVVGDTTV